MTKPSQYELDLARQLQELWETLQDEMDEVPAFEAACEQLEIETEEGYELLSLLADSDDELEDA